MGGAGRITADPGGRLRHAGIVTEGFDSRAIAAAVLAVVLAVALGAVAGTSAGPAAGIWASLAGLVPPAALAVALQRHTQAMRRARRRVRLLERFAVLGEAPEAARVLLTTPLLAAMTAVSAVSWFFECLAAYVCVRGLHLGLSLADTIVVFSLGSLAGALSFLPGGVGVAETSMTALIRALGDVSRAAAVAGTVLIRLATLWFAVAIGLVGLAVEERLARRQRQPVSARRSSMR